MNQFCPHCGALFAPDVNLEFSTTQLLCVECGLPLEESSPELPPAENDDEQVAYDLAEWPPEDRVVASDDLIELGIPYRWEDGLVLVVPATAEEQVDALLDEIDENAVTTNEDALLDVGTGEDGGEEATTAMSDLFIAADNLQHGVYDEEKVVEFIEAAAAVESCLPPFGVEAIVWQRVQNEAAAIVTALQKGNEGDDDEGVITGARSLRDLLRHYV